jgi:hypothetical protein
MTDRPSTTEPSATEPITWAEDADIKDVARYASYEFPQFLILFCGAERRKSDAEMAEHVQAMRHIVTRIDQYRRMKAKQWKAKEKTANESNP